jgi:hypothetical protein
LGEVGVEGKRGISRRRIFFGGFLLILMLLLMLKGRELRAKRKLPTAWLQNVALRAGGLSKEHEQEQDEGEGRSEAGASRLHAGRVLLVALGAPRGAVLDDPVEQGLFKSNILPGLFALDPFVTEDLFALGEELLIQERLPD